MTFPQINIFVALARFALAGSVSATLHASPPVLPLVLEPGITQRGQAPETWIVDMRELDEAKVESLARGLSSRLYSTATFQTEPMTFRTNFQEEKVFGFFLSRAAQGGASVEILIDGEFFHRLSWMGGQSTHIVDALYYFPIPAGERQITLRAVSGVVVIDRYYFLNTTDDVPQDHSMKRLEQEARPVAGGKDDGYRGIWFTLGQFSEFGDKYSGGLGTYTANHIPLAIYAKEVDKTFFVYGGTIHGEQHLLIMASNYDHANHRVPRPTVVHDKQGVNDPHDNPSIAMDGDGHIWVFVSGRGRGRPGFIYRSVSPYDVEEFELVQELEITYPQPWWVEGEGFIHMFTKYTRGRELYWSTSPDGYTWSEDQKLAGILGHYQVSSRHGNKIGTFFNRHPQGSVDRRTDLYYAQTTDMGRSWTTADGQALAVPMEEEDNPARVIDYSAQGRLMYTVDLNWDADGNPVLLYVTSGGFEPGPQNEPRFWEIARWTGSEWENHIVCRSDHNYDLGSLHIFEDRWLIIGPTAVGPQPWQTGGEIEMWESRDSGRKWTKIRQVTVNSERNHKFVRRPVNAQDPFFAFWADGDPTRPGISNLFFGDSTGEQYWVLPYDMEEDEAQPQLASGSSE